MAIVRAPTLTAVEDISTFGATESGRVLQMIRRDMEVKQQLFRRRRRNEEVLALAYQDRMAIGGDAEWGRMRENALNLPYRLLRWYESQATSKKVVVKVNRNAGPGQRPGSQTGDDKVGGWLGVMLGRAAHAAGFRRETKALISEIVPRGTSVMSIGYHEEVVSWRETKEASKSPEEIAREVLAGSDLEAKEGQDHLEASKSLAGIVTSGVFRLAAGAQKVQELLVRKKSHDDADEKAEREERVTELRRMIRRRVYMKQRRVGEDVGWAPWIYDTEDAPWWWDRHVWSVADVKRSDMFTDEFKENVKGFDSRISSGLFPGGQVPSAESMDTDSERAQNAEPLTDDEKLAEFFVVWIRYPHMRSGGVRKIVSAEYPEKFIQADDSNPHVDKEGNGLIPGFFPFYDFTPIQTSLPVPQRTCGIPPMAVGMTQFEKLCEYNRLRHASALRHSLRLYGLHPSQAKNKKLHRALKRGEDGFWFVEDNAQRDTNGKFNPGVNLYQFTGNTQEIDKQAAREESDWIKVQGMPPAILQGMGTAETLGQDRQGIAAGERESNTLIIDMELRMADVFAGMRGLIRGNYKRDDFEKMLGSEGADALILWQTETVDDGDEIEVTLGIRAQAQETVNRKQLMEAIALIRQEVEPMTGTPIYDHFLLIEELFRSLDVGTPAKSRGPMLALQKLVNEFALQLEELTGVNPLTGKGTRRADAPTPGPNPQDGPPSEENLDAGARRGTVSTAPAGA